MLTVSNVYSGYGKKDVLKDISFQMEKGQFICILGANGCGKTTLLKTLLGLIKPSRGTVALYGKNIYELKEIELAQKIAYIPQAHIPPFPFTVQDVILMGRTPYINKMAIPSEGDLKIARMAMEQLGIQNLAPLKYTELSGGQRQMVIIARALTQEPDILLMDEPTANLDFGNQHIVLEQIYRLSRSGMSVILVSHNPNHALLCADKVIIMKEGQIMDMGTPATVITAESMRTLYNTEVAFTSLDLPGKRKLSVCVSIPTLDYLQADSASL